MTATEILYELERRGVHLEVAGDKVRWRPKEAVTPDLVEALRQRKAEILGLLSRATVAGQTRQAVQARVRGQEAVSKTAKADVCWHCRGTGKCQCACCGAYDARRTWVAAQCAACKGTGFLTWGPQAEGCEDWIQ